MGKRTQGKTTLQVNTTGIFMPKGVFGVSYWSSSRRFKGARDGPSSAALKRLNCPTVTPDAATTLSASSDSLFLYRVIAALSSSSLHPAINLRPPSMTVSSHAPRSSAAAFQSPSMPKARTSSATVRLFLFLSPRPALPWSLHPAKHDPVGQPTTVHTDERPRNLLVRTVVSMLSHPVRVRASA